MKKYIPFIIISLWSLWAIIIHGDLKPSDNLILWLLCTTSITYTIIFIIIFFIKIR